MEIIGYEWDINGIWKDRLMGYTCLSGLSTAGLPNMMRIFLSWVLPSILWFLWGIEWYNPNHQYDVFVSHQFMVFSKMMIQTIGMLFQFTILRQIYGMYMACPHKNGSVSCEKPATTDHHGWCTQWKLDMAFVLNLSRLAIPWMQIRKKTECHGWCRNLLDAAFFAFYCNCLVGTSSTFAQIIQIILEPQPQAEKIISWNGISTEWIGLRVNPEETLQICGVFPKKLAFRPINSSQVLRTPLPPRWCWDKTKHLRSRYCCAWFFCIRLAITARILTLIVINSD